MDHRGITGWGTQTRTERIWARMIPATAPAPSDNYYAREVSTGLYFVSSPWRGFEYELILHLFLSTT
jgi:hypothetical protein